MTRRLNRWLLFLLIVFGVPFYWLLVEDGWSVDKTRSLDIAQLRRLAASKPGPYPTAIHYERIAERTLPISLLAAGQGLKLTRLAVTVHLLEVPGRAPIMIDSGLSQAAATKLNFGDYDAAAQARVDAMIPQADFLVLLGDGAVHVDGLRRLRSAHPDGTVRAIGALKDERCAQPRPLVPGVVDIPMCRGLIGSRMLFVRLASGAEYLFAGDIAPLYESWATVSARSRLVTDFYATEQRGEVRSWLRAVKNLNRRNPELRTVPGYSSLSPPTWKPRFADGK